MPAAVKIFAKRLTIPRNGNGDGRPDTWSALRRLVGARPSGIVQFHTRRSRLDELRSGEKLLIVRKYGGLGDILISSMIFPMLIDQYPGIHVTYACPKSYHPLFEGSGLSLRPYEDIFSGESQYHRGVVRPQLLDEYELIEDISTPCRHWEIFFRNHGGMDPGGNGLRWRNRLDIWCGWFGLKIRNPRSCITIREGEKIAVKRVLARLAGVRRPVCLLAPFSSNSIKSYPWFEDLARRLESSGWAPILLHPATVRSSFPTLSSLSLRQMGAACAVADLIVSVDSSAFHWGGILGRPTIGIHNINDGATYAQYYPTVRVVQTCDTPCIMSRYSPGGIYCSKQTAEPLPAVRGVGTAVSRCYHKSSVAEIAATAEAMSPGRAG